MSSQKQGSVLKCGPISQRSWAASDSLQTVVQDGERSIDPSPVRSIAARGTSWASERTSSEAVVAQGRSARAERGLARATSGSAADSPTTESRTADGE